MEERTTPGSITFAAIMCLIMGLCCGGTGILTGSASAVSGPQRKMMAQTTVQMQQQLDTQKQNLRRRREETDDENERARIDQELAVLEGFKAEDMAAAFQAWLSPAVANTYLFEGVSAVLLNLMMFIAGCGLFGLAAWARKLAIVSAIGRLITAAITVILVFTVLVPAMQAGMERMQQMAQNMAAATGGPAPPMPDMGAAMLMWGIIATTFYMVLFCTWPIVLVVLLNTRTAKQAFGAGEAPPVAPLPG